MLDVYATVSARLYPNHPLVAREAQLETPQRLTAVRIAQNLLPAQFLVIVIRVTTRCPERLWIVALWELTDQPSESDSTRYGNSDHDPTLVLYHCHAHRTVAQ